MVADNTLVDSRYLIVRRIGSGGMADVYCAEDTHLGLVDKPLCGHKNLRSPRFRSLCTGCRVCRA